MVISYTPFLVLLFAILVFIIFFLAKIFFFGSTLLCKATLYGFDIVYIFLCVSFYSKDFFKMFASGYAISFWCVTLGLFAVGFYFALLSFLHNKAPKISYILHFFMVYLGVYFVVPYLTKLFTGLLLKKEMSYLHFLDNQVANKIFYFILFFIIAIKLYKKRMKFILKNIHQEYTVDSKPNDSINNI